MRAKFDFCKKESGQAIVLFAVVLTVLIGFGALAVDVGRVAVEKSNLQNAADAAALAAAHALPTETLARSAAENYANVNGVTAPVTVAFSDSDKKVTVTVSKPVEYTFAKVIGFNSTTVTVKAAAIAASVFDSFKYSLFSGSSIDLLALTGQNTIVGDVHSNNSIKISGHTDVDGTVTAVGNIEDGGLAATQEVKSASNNIAMPDFTSVKNDAYIYSNGTHYLTLSADDLNNLLAEHPVTYFDGELVINGSGITTTGCMIVSGDISFTGSGVDMTSTTSICLCSLNGSIKFAGGGEDIYGIIYAPNGTVELKGHSDQLYGSIIANEIDSSGGMNITYDDDAAKNSVPATKRKLVE